MTELSYESIVDEYARERKNTLIPNSKPIHARYIVYKLFGLARKSVRLYTGALVPSIKSDSGKTIKIYSWNRLIDAAIDFLNRDEDSQLNILLERPVEDLQNHPLIKRIKEEKLEDRLRLRKLASREKLGEKAEHHFMTAEDSAFRMELNHKKVRAVANFNDPETASLLNSFFDKIFESPEFSTPVTI